MIVLLSVIKTFDNCVILRQIYGLLVTLIFCNLFEDCSDLFTYLLWEKLFWWWLFYQIQERRSDFGWLILLLNYLFLSKNKLFTLSKNKKMTCNISTNVVQLFCFLKEILKSELLLEKFAKTSCWKNRQYRFLIQNFFEICDLV